MLKNIFLRLFDWLVVPVLRFVSRAIIHYIEQPTLNYRPQQFIGQQALETVLKPGDILLVEGNQRISVAIKYLTQSTWSHAAFYVGDKFGLKDKDGFPANLIEADLTDGVIPISIAKYVGFNVRICRPARLRHDDQRALVEFMLNALGNQYDIRNVFDLARYLLPQPPVPMRHRRKLIALGSGEPSRAICSTLIAQAFQSIRYPILPRITRENAREVHHIRHHSLFVPRDFDLSPYFEVVKPTLYAGFNYKKILWGSQEGAQLPERAQLTDATEPLRRPNHLKGKVPMLSAGIKSFTSRWPPWRDKQQSKN